ncbi:hypothetical protein BGW37DRAFT_479801 [Umbelopsis sp. PMI_123]|nr:hypothetical protein BGW37DRAFT_479801 [Umbelopsis sp. PMI_123]
MVVNNMLVDSLCSSLNTLSLGSLSLQEIIKIKKERRLAENRLRDAVEEQGRQRLTCSSCGQRGHGNRRSRQCPNNARAQCKLIKYATTLTKIIAEKTNSDCQECQPRLVPQPCPSCNSTEYSSTRSKLCPFHSKSTNELLEEAVGKAFERFTRKCPFESVVRSTYRPPLHDAVIKLSGYLRSVIVLNKPVTTTNGIIPVDALQNVWTSLTRQHPSLNSPPQITLRRSADVLAEASRVKNYLKYKISANFPTLKNALVWRLIEKYALPRIATGDGDWPEDWPEDVSLIMSIGITLFSIGPLSSMGWRFISLNAGLLASILPSIRAPSNLDELRLKNHKSAFASRILTDGYAVNFLFARKRDAEIATYFEVAAIDPGRTQVFTAAYGSGQERHQIRRCSTSEYYSMTGSKRRNQKLQQEKKEAGILRIEESWPTGKTCNIGQYQSYVAHLLNNFDELSKL